ncbi:MAG TPA: hypothetical protein VFC00_16570 [Micromonosporaceae bacterium]|nr:hypothetical protein [Micromonosporaceae bacterium]
MTGQQPQPEGSQLHRLCVFDVSLDCGHIATVAIDGWYPVSVACCDRLGGTILRGVYRPYDSHVEDVNVLSATYEHRPAGTPREPTRLFGRRDRTDAPRQPAHRWDHGTAGRYPARVGATWNLDYSTPPATHD